MDVNKREKVVNCILDLPSIDKHISNLILKYLGKKTDAKKTAIYGCGAVSQCIIQKNAALVEKKVACFVETTPRPTRRFHNFPILSPMELQPSGFEHVIIASISFQDAMMQELSAVYQGDVISLRQIVEWGYDQGYLESISDFHSLSVFVLKQNERSWTLRNDDVRMMTIQHQSMIKLSDKVFTVGSCFAQEIRSRLQNFGFDVFPKIPGPPDGIWAKIGRGHSNLYHTYSILQELQKAKGMWEQTEKDYWQVKDNWFGGQVCYQDPYRRSIFGRTLKDLMQYTQTIDHCILEGLKKANVFIFTLGLIETWKFRNGNRFACTGPGWEGGGGKGLLEFKLSSFEDNYLNMVKAIELVRGFNPDAKIFISVSPVPLGKTRTDNGCIAANMESKAVLRAVAGELSRTQEICYFPSYEIACHSKDSYIDDGRHVKPEIVELITQTFFDAYVQDQ